MRATTLMKAFGLLTYLLISPQHAHAANEPTSTIDGDAAIPSITLKPHLPPGHQTNHISTLHPQDNGQHFYTPDGKLLDPGVPTTFAQANITYQRPAVVLPYTSLVRYTRCLLDGLRIGFESEEAYKYVETHWPRYLDAPHLTPRGNAEGFANALKDSNNQTGFLLITESLHCDASESGLHAYWHVSKLDFDDERKTVSATAVEVGVDGAFDDVSLVWGSTHSDEEDGPLIQSRFSSGSPGGPAGSGPDTRPKPLSKRQNNNTSAVVLPWYANIPQANLTTVQWNTVQATPQYYITPPTGTTWTAADRFTVLTLQSNTTSNLIGTLVYGYGGQSANQIQPQLYYALTSPSRELAPGYYLPPMASGSCGVRLITYVYKEPSAGAINVARPGSRDAFDVTKYAASAGLGQPIASNFLTVMNGPAAAACTRPVTTVPPTTSTTVATPNGVITSTTYTAPLVTTVTLDTKPIATGCVNPPSDYKGLLTSKCGENFDRALDDRLGYIDFLSDPMGAQKLWAPDLTPGLRRRSLTSGGRENMQQNRRWTNPFSWIKKAVNKAIDFLKEQAKKAAQALNQLIGEAEHKVVELTNIVVNTLNKEISQSFNQGFDISVPFGGNIRAEWKDKTAVELFSNKDRPGEKIYCVDCGVNGTATMSGAIGFRVLPPNLSTATVRVGGSLHAGVGLGLTGNSTFTKEFTKRIATQPVPRAYIKVADLFEGGLALTVDAVVDIELQTSGQVIFGMDLYMDRFDASLDLVGSNTQASGITPRVEKRFEVNGPLQVKAALAVPVQFGLKLVVIPIKWDRSTGLRNTPIMKGTGTYQDPSCDGIKYDLDFEDRFDAESFGKLTKLKSWEVNDINQGCYVQVARPSGWVKPKTTTTMPPKSTTIPLTPTTTPTSTSLPSGAAIKVAPSSPNANREFFEWALFPDFLFFGMPPTLRGPYTTPEACAQKCLEEKDGCIAASQYGDQCSLYYPTRPNGDKLGVGETTHGVTASMYLGSCEEAQAALPSYPEAHRACQRFYPDVPTSPDSPNNAGEISTSWCAITGVSLAPIAQGVNTPPGKSLKDCWAQCLSTYYDCAAVVFDPNTGTCTLTAGDRGSNRQLTFLAAKSPVRTLVSYPCEDVFISSDRTAPRQQPNRNKATPYRYFPGYSDSLGLASDSPLSFGLFEASEFAQTIFASPSGEISAGGFVNADTLSKCSTGCLTVAACQAVGYTRLTAQNKPICRFYKAPGDKKILGASTFNSATTVVMGRCGNAARYLDSPLVKTTSRCVRYYPITDRAQGSLRRRAAGSDLGELSLPGPIMDTPEVATALAQSAQTNATENQADLLISLVDLTGAFALAPAQDASLYLSYAGQAATYKFAALSNAMVYGDGASSAFWFYPNTMATLGISRLRFGDFSIIPKTSQQVTLVSVDADNDPRTPGTYVATTGAGQNYHLAFCLIDNRQTKAFLVKDPVAGLAQLQAPESQYTVTGGPTSGCVMAVLQSPGFPGL